MGGVEARCAFCEIVAGAVAAHVVFADEVAIGFLDRTPVFKGHVLVIPRGHYETLADLPDELVGPLVVRAKRVAQAIGMPPDEGGLGAAGTFVAINNTVSQSVPHLHVHVVPRNRKDGLKGFFWPRQRYDGADEMTAVAADLAGAYRAVLAAGT